MRRPKYFYKSFTTNPSWQVVTDSNLKSLRKLLFYLTVIANNNLLFKIYCENVVELAFFIERRTSALVTWDKTHKGLES